MTPTNHLQNTLINALDVVAGHIPRFVALATWVWYLVFLFCPVINNSGHDRYFTAADNLTYLLIGLTLTVATQFACESQDMVRAVIFAGDVVLLSYWF